MVKWLKYSLDATVAIDVWLLNFVPLIPSDANLKTSYDLWINSKNIQSALMVERTFIWESKYSTLRKR